MMTAQTRNGGSSGEKWSNSNKKLWMPSCEMMMSKLRAT